MTRNKNTDTPPTEEGDLLPPPPPKVVISGYYGFDNLGDELILSVLTDHLLEKGAEVTVLSANPAATLRRHKVHAIHRMSVIDIVTALSQADLFISGGGGLFQDASGPLSPWYYGAMVGLARYFEVPVCFWGQGIGPLQYSATEWITRFALNCCMAISVRDEPSAQIVEHLTGQRPVVATDPVWLYDLPAPEASSNNLPEHHQMQSDKIWNIGVSLRPAAELTPERIAQLAAFLKRYIDDSTRPVQFVLIPFHPEDDPPVLAELGRELTALNAATFKIVEPHRVSDALQQCHVLFGMRFHSILLAALSDVAVYGLIYDPKVRQLLKQLGLQGSEVSQFDQLNVENIRHYFQRYPAPDLTPLRKQARANLDILDQSLENALPEMPMLR